MSQLECLRLQFYYYKTCFSFLADDLCSSFMGNSEAAVSCYKVTRFPFVSCRITEVLQLWTVDCWRGWTIEEKLCRNS